MTDYQSAKVVKIRYDQNEDKLFQSDNLEEEQFVPVEKTIFWKCFGGLFVILLMVEGFWKLEQIFQKSSFLGFVYLSLFVLACVGCFCFYDKEKKCLEACNQQAECKKITDYQECLKYLSDLAVNKNPVVFEQYKKWKSEAITLTDAGEISKIYSQYVLEPYIDKQVSQQIVSYSLKAAGAVVVSPFVLSDMCFVGMISLKMLKQIAELYGLKVGYYSRIKIYHHIFVNMISAGGLELIHDLSTTLGIGVLKKMSGQLGQALTTSLFVLRLGTQIAKEYRPVDFNKKNEISFLSLGKEVVARFKDKNLIEDEKSI